MKYLSALITDGRKKLGDTVFSRNPSGGYIRARVKPANPQTEYQQQFRTVFSGITKSWRTLTPTQIAGWNLLASQVTHHDSLGQSYHPSGIALYCSCNTNLQTNGTAPLSDPPQNSTIPSAPPIEDLALDVSESPDLILTFTLPGYSDESPIQPSFFITAGYSTGINFLAPFMYRRCFYSEWTAETNQWQIFAVQGMAGSFPTNGQMVSLGYKNVDHSTGFASKMQTASILVEGL